jgi:hypothetical protein
MHGAMYCSGCFVMVWMNPVDVGHCYDVYVQNVSSWAAPLNPKWHVLGDTEVELKEIRESLNWCIVQPGKLCQVFTEVIKRLHGCMALHSLPLNSHY